MTRFSHAGHRPQAISADEGATRPTRPQTPDDGRGSEATAEILRQVRKIEVRTRRLVSSLAAGPYRSAFRGQGMAFEEVREYTPGDDVRLIDWNVTARTGSPFIKVFREERELTLFLLVDVSGSMRFGAIPGVSPRAKLALAAEAAAVVAVTALKNNDRIGLVSFSDRTELHLPPRKGRGHVARVLREILAAQAGTRPTDLAHALDELVRVTDKRCVCFLVSDFLAQDLGRFKESLARAGRRHDVVGLRVCDPAEERLPDGSAPLVLADPEGDGVAVLANNASGRARYAKAWSRARSEVRTAFQATGNDLVELTTTASALTALERFFRQRRRHIHG